jgi:hypothetical protein
LTCHKTCDLYTSLINQLKEKLFDTQFIQRHRIGAQSFTRNRLLPFETIVLFLVNLIKGSVQDELDHFFKSFHNAGTWQRVVSKSAFCRARMKLSYLVFVELNQILIRFFYRHFPVRTWQGFTLMAIDGSTVGPPSTPQTFDYFGGVSSRNKKPYTLARVSQLFDVLNHVTVHALISPLSVGEREMAADHLLYIRPTDLVLLDQGYPAFWLFKLILKTGGQFCARISPRIWNQVGAFHQSGNRETTIKITGDTLAKKRCRELGLDHQPITLRLVRIGPEDQIIITSLTDSHAYPADIFDDLYHQRWRVEVDYNHQKNKLVVENWSGRSVLSVYQDFHAKVFAKNLAAVLIHPVQDEVDRREAHRKYKYQVNWTQAISKCKDCVASLFFSSQITKIITALQGIFRKSIEPIRPGRKAPRNKNLLRANYKHAYKPLR